MNVITFAFPSADHFAELQSPVRVLSRDGEPWFVAADIAELLGYRDAANMTRNLDDDEKGTHNLSIRSDNGIEQLREVLIINESGLYSAILRSRRKEAKRFKKWVTSTVLPLIRQHGGYLAGQESLSPTLVAALHKTIRENALPALRYYDKLTEHDHWKSPARRKASDEWAIQETALKFDLPVSLMAKLTDQGVSALSA
ncbi:Bro-N domain-containing protein [Laribacter hongkongensis]|uniref:BRO-N domain-containing protein n=1 Tax=Laribacter hongkongensis TaxID=168471 RepID=UPI001EFE788F|nr:Bro-N domain-containing protein [Laribacter hongkongensis]MCG9055672.1 Bro-N domain-containing protein [Laribacter hongkongensis]